MWDFLHNRTVQAVSSWLGIFAVIYAVLSKLSKALLGPLTWPEALLVGIALALATMLILAIMLAIGAWGYRLIKPLSPPERQQLATDNLVKESDLLREDLRRAVDACAAVENKLGQSNARIGLLEANLRAQDDDLQSAKDGEAVSLREAIQSFMKAPMLLATELHDSVGKRLDLLASKIEELRGGCAKLEETVKKNENDLRESLYAVFNRERLREISDEILVHTDTLYLRFKAGEVYTPQEWDDWTDTEFLWERLLKEWIDTSRFYAPDVQKRVMTINDKEYDGEWEVRDNQFPTADAVRRFKRFRILYRHWVAVKADVDTGAMKVAFLSGSEKEQHRGQFHR